jgi:hypothetical protein
MAATLLPVGSPGHSWEPRFPAPARAVSPARRASYSQALFDVAVEHRLRHGGNATLREQAAAAVAQDTQGNGWALYRKVSTEPIEGIIALAMAVEGAVGDDGPPELLVGHA